MFIGIFAFVLGTIVGSFLNVCIYRFPRNESIVFPSSRCPLCEKKIAWRDNVPIFSFLLLRGRCRYCGHRIPGRYLVVELLTGVAFLGIFLLYGITADCFIAALFFSLLIVATFVDFEHQEIPDQVTIGGLVAGLLIGVLFPGSLTEGSRWESFVYSLSGALLGGGMLYAMGFIGEFIFKKEAMGGGDVKLLAMVGAFVGWKLVLLTFFIAPFFGSIVGIIARFKEGKDTIPYGPYLSMGAVIAFLFGDRILEYLFLGV